ncbi:aldose epimerase family protein [Treponema phagedenis]|uniref:aldose epimerase family protein n=1 Tax=Treponema phagedenis TaxID=162 RepID=UPI0015A46C45|nr:aldose epimerase family protein [Treponema phagedenis]QLC59441.1 galactose mutarotase [Treponema phagedenis]
MKVKKRTFGVLASGQKVSIYTISNDEMSFSAIDYGCCITSILLPSKSGGFDDVTLGYSTLDGYIHNTPHFGSLIGRYAGRIKNAEFALGARKYLLTPNAEGKHCLHGGYPSYDKEIWNSKYFCHSHEAGVCFDRISPDGEQGFPGKLTLTVTYTLTCDNEIIIRYEAFSTRTSPINLTNHTYFNLNPPGMRADGRYVLALNHELQIFSDLYVETDKELLPTGNFVSVEGTPYDFRNPKLLRTDIERTNGGYDGTWFIGPPKKDQKMLAAIIREPMSKREISVFSTQPGLTMYTANFLKGEIGKNGDAYNPQSAVCLESQHLPDSPNQANFPPAIVTPDIPYRHETSWLFKCLIFYSTLVYSK